MKLLCTDLDRTLLPNGEQPESALARPLLWHLLESRHMKLAYVSGRDLGRVLQAIAEYELQHPDAIVADVGTSIYVPVDGDWQLHQQWHEHIGADWNGLDSDGIATLVNRIDAGRSMQPQEDDRQSRYKRSYYLPMSLDTQALSETLQTHLSEQGVHASLIFSDDPLKAVKLLDILPVHATKLEAVMHIQSMLNIDHDQCLFSGDSGNDVTALASPLLSVTVANADMPTRRAVQELAMQNGTGSGSYQAEGGIEVAGGHCLNGNYAAGIIEGLLHFRPDWRASLLDREWVDAALSNRDMSAELGTESGTESGAGA